MISSSNEHVFIRDSCDLTLQLTFDACWSSMNAGSTRPIVWKNCRHAPRGDSICDAEWRTPAALASYVLFVMKCSPSLRMWDQLKGETLVGTSAYCTVKQINRVGSYRIDLLNGRWNSFGHTE